MLAHHRTTRPQRGRRRLITALAVLAAGIGSAGWTSSAHAQLPAIDTGQLPLPTEIPLGELQGIDGVVEGLPSLGGLFSFKLTDEPGSWFDTGLNLFGTKSLALSEAPLSKVRFESDPADTDSNHTVTSLLWPSGAKNMPFDQEAAWKKGEREVDLKTPGLYAFVCKMHPFMLGAVIKDDPVTPGLDLGKKATYAGGREMPTDSDLYWRIIRAFFIVTNTGNWQDFTSKNKSQTWDPNYAPAPLIAHDADGKMKLIPLLDVFMQKRFKEPIKQPPLFKPEIPGVGEVWVNLQYEQAEGNKGKPGTVTALDAKTFDVKKKFALPSAGLNNPHNMWPTRDQKLMYTTNWFGQSVTTFERETGKVVADIDVGDAPAHVMTRVDTDQVHVGLNGENSVVELAPGGNKIDRVIPVGRPGEKQTQPHAHGMSADGKIMVTPNSNTDDTTQIDVPSGKIAAKTATGHLPIAAWVHPDGLKHYSSNFLEGTVSCVSTTKKPACAEGKGKKVKQTKIDLMANYNQETGAITGPYGGLNIQTPVSPDGHFVMQANTLTATVTIIETATNKLVKALPCEAGCHGINFGAKKGGGYYAYVTNKFSNTLDIVDPDPDGDTDAHDAKVVGRVTMETKPGTVLDDKIIGLPGQGGQGVMPIPNVNNGWVQKLPDEFKEELSPDQLDPLGTAEKAKK